MEDNGSVASGPAADDRRVYWCPTCRAWYLVRGDSRPVCPTCMAPASTYTCTRCGKTWTPRRVDPPKHCSRCNSPYWNRMRTAAHSKRRA